MQQRHLERFQDHADYDGSDVHRSPNAVMAVRVQFFVRERERPVDENGFGTKDLRSKKFRMILVPSCMMMFLFNSRWFSIPTWQNPWGGLGFPKTQKVFIGDSSPPQSTRPLQLPTRMDTSVLGMELSKLCFLRRLQECHRLEKLCYIIYIYTHIGDC